MSGVDERYEIEKNLAQILLMLTNTTDTTSRLVFTASG